MRLSKLFTTAAAASVLAMSSAAMAATVTFEAPAIGSQPMYTDLGADVVFTPAAPTGVGFTVDSGVLFLGTEVGVGGPVKMELGASWAPGAKFNVLGFDFDDLSSGGSLEFYSGTTLLATVTSGSFSGGSLPAGLTELSSLTIALKYEGADYNGTLDNIEIELYLDGDANAVPLPGAAMSGSALMGVLALGRRRK